MKLLDQNGHQATVSFSRKEALMMLIYVQTAREELCCTSPRGKEIDRLFCQITQQFLNNQGRAWQTGPEPPDQVEPDQESGAFSRCGVRFTQCLTNKLDPCSQASTM
jgi:hypothetical protein